MEINPLAIKGFKLLCELCNKPGHLMCTGCRQTYYCNKEHQDIDFKGIHENICSMISITRAVPKQIGSEEERANRDLKINKLMNKILDISLNEARKFCFAKKYDLAFPAALQSLKTAMFLYGKGSIWIVPSYLLLGEASIGLKQIESAENYLSMAKWAVTKDGGDAYDIQAQLCRSLGLLYVSKGNYKDGLIQFAENV